MKFFSIPTILLAAIPISFGFLPTLDTKPAPGQQFNRIAVFRASPFEIRPGDSITINGSGFSRTLNKVYFSGSFAVNATSSDGTTLSLQVPTQISSGQYEISVANVLGSSANQQIPISIKVTNSPQPSPVITTASFNGERITLTGEGFTSANNLVTSLGNSSKPISASGKTLTFAITDLSLYAKIKQSFAGRRYPVILWIYVQNEHGTSKNPYRLDLVI
jgi:hypothetical protein